MSPSQHALRTRIGALVAVGAIAALATACNGDDKKDAKDGGGSASGDKGKYAGDLQAYLKTTSQGAHVQQVRAEKTAGADYTVTVNTDLGAPDTSATEETLKVQESAEKLVNAAEKWVQEHTDLKVMSIEVLDKNKGVKGIENLDNKPKDKAANDAYAKELLAGIKASANGSKVTDVKVYAGLTGSGNKIVVYTHVATRTGDVEGDIATMDAGAQVANEAKQWAQDHTQVKAASVVVLDSEMGMAGIENL
ncbi:hypothetical protein [Yinghuangia seranimata]|uniref:hypothetical protein n=1 Tax=Yinghuangia seranimata TaxID=408067 RepID=UPI00248ADA3B|nr:hypothetical protein [Yinghuangia seranimata]MDI2126080.1 hypothetical protein [Yinghuangia seranimata]